MRELDALDMLIADEAAYQHWRDKNGHEAFSQVQKWIHKIRCRDLIVLSDRQQLWPPTDDEDAR